MNLAVPLSRIEDIKPLCEQGADIFIIGVDEFTHRMNNTYSLNEIKPIIKVIKDLKKQVWLNLNALIDENSISKLKSSLKTITSWSIDGILFADLAVLYFARQLNIVNQLIYYPETYLMNNEDIKYFETRGIKAAVLGRELTLEEITQLTKTSQLPLHIIGHGMLNMFHSKRPLLENYFNYIQVPYDASIAASGDFSIQETNRDAHYKIIQDHSGTHIFRARPLASFKILNILKTSLDTLIIDNIFLTSEETLEVVKDYRDALQEETVTYWIQKYQEEHDDGFYYKSTKTLKRGD